MSNIQWGDPFASIFSIKKYLTLVSRIIFCWRASRKSKPHSFVEAVRVSVYQAGLIDLIAKEIVKRAKKDKLKKPIIKCVNHI